jgi:uncharacterized membrane protein (UPF0127 family)
VKLAFRPASLAVLLAAAACLGLGAGSVLARPLLHAQHAAARTELLEVVTSTGKVVRLHVEVVDTEPAREHGLMFRKSLPADGGMLFDFKTTQDVSFWMKNTLIPLDMLFIDKSGRIANIYRQATPHSLTPIPSDGPVLGVLEIAGGRAQDLDIMPGDKVRHRIFNSH